MDRELDEARARWRSRVQEWAATLVAVLAILGAPWAAVAYLGEPPRRAAVVTLLSCGVVAPASGLDLGSARRSLAGTERHLRGRGASAASGPVVVLEARSPIVPPEGPE